MSKIIGALFIFILLFIYGGKAWDNIKERINKYINPEAQKAMIFDSLKNNLTDLEKVITEINSNPENPEIKSKTTAGLKLIKKTQNDITELENIENREKGLIGKIGKTIKTINNIKKLAGNEEKNLNPETSPKIILPPQNTETCQKTQCQCETP